MCGIAGYFSLNGDIVSEDVVRTMTDQIAHRGPDDAGVWTGRNIGLGHRRLSILDLSEAGHQPMRTSDGRWVLSYNGELYNFREIRVELEALGYCFQSTSDTEVVLYAFAEWGTHALARFNGMFALAIWDCRESTLYLARDRYGIKPLYTSCWGHTFLFGSEVKALKAHPNFKAKIDREALLEYFTFQNFFTDKTLFENVTLVPAGHWMRISEKHPEGELQCYWDFEFSEPENPASHEEYLEELDRLFCQAVERQLVSDVELGSYLSGGVDSGSITALASRQSESWKTFTCGFDLHSASGLELNFDEREASEYMSYLFKTEHYEMVLKAGDMERCMQRLCYHLEEPRVGQSYPNFYVAQLAGKFVKVVLSGAGGDEIFGGYPWRYYRAVVNDDFENYVDKYYLYWQRLIPNTVIQKVFRPIWSDVKDVWTRDIFRDVFGMQTKSLTRPEDYINASLYFEAKTFLHGLLVMEDKLSMAHGLETRLPFLDNDLVDFAQQLPAALKLGNLEQVSRINENETAKLRKFYSKTKDGKLLLREMMARHVPHEVAEKIKQGFSAPDASWFKGDSIEFVKRLLLDKNAALYEYLDYKPTTELIHEHLDGKQNRRLLVWSLIYFEHWIQNFIDG